MVSLLNIWRTWTRDPEVCDARFPPGDEIYRDVFRIDGAGVELSLFEVDGALQPSYCQQLGYMAKMFLESKNLNNNMKVFLFYVLGEWDEYGSPYAQLLV